MTATSDIFNVPTDMSIASPELLAREIHQLRPGLTLYFGGNKWKQIQVFGSFMWFPPDKRGETVLHPVFRIKDGSRLAVVGDGRVQIKDKVGFIYNTVPGLGGTRAAPTYGALVGQDVIAQARFIVNKHPYIVWLRGDKTDGEQIARARNAWMGSRIMWARAVMDRRRKKVEDFRRNSPGVNPPPPTNKEEEAQGVMDSNLGPTQWKEFVCEYFDAHFDSFAEYRDHMMRTHNKSVAEPEGTVAAQVAEDKKIAEA